MVSHFHLYLLLTYFKLFSISCWVSSDHLTDRPASSPWLTPTLLGVNKSTSSKVHLPHHSLWWLLFTYIIGFKLLSTTHKAACLLKPTYLTGFYFYHVLPWTFCLNDTKPLVIPCSRPKFHTSTPHPPKPSSSSSRAGAVAQLRLSGQCFAQLLAH